MTAKFRSGRTALTEYRVVERFSGYTLLEVRIGTGRTHQIRVHVADMGHPVAGDSLYRGNKLFLGNRSAAPRMFLHAARIGFVSPARGERVIVEAPLPPELADWLAGLRGQAAYII